MIYCFKGCTGCCDGCGKACGGCCDGIGKACDAACKGCGGICTGCSAIFAPIFKVFDRPLGWYVLLTGFINLPASACAAAALASAQVKACSKHPLMAFCAVDTALGILHTGMALYLQTRLVHGLQRDSVLVAAHGAPAASAALQGHGQVQGQAQALTSKELMNRAGQIVLYDIGFCLYLFAFAFSFVFNCMGFGWISGCKSDTGLPYVAAVLLIIFFVVAMNFAFLWFCALMCTSCCSGLFGGSRTGPQRPALMRVILGKEVGTVPGSTPATVMGTPAVRGQPVYAMPIQVGSAVGAQAPVAQAMPEPSAPPAPSHQQQHQQPAGTAAKVAANGLDLVGGGLQAAGRWLGGATAAKPRT